MTSIQKYLSFAAAGAIIIGLSQSAFAGYQLKDNYNHFYFDVGAAVNYLEPPSFKIDTLGASSASKTPLAKLEKRDAAPQANLAFGYKFFNYGNSPITALFGHENSVEVKFHYSDFNQSNSETFDPEKTIGTIWKIDGSGFVLKEVLHLSDFNLKANHTDFGSGIYFKGNKYFANPNFSLNPYAGLIYDNIQDEYKYIVRYFSSLKPPPPIAQTANENYQISSNYFGAILGSRLNYNIKPQLSLFADLSWQFLYINSSLDANQKFTDPSEPYRKVRDSRSTTTYRAKLALGINFKFTNESTAPNIDLQAGIDRLGDWPKVISASANKKAHLDGETVNNYFAGLTLHIPFA